MLVLLHAHRGGPASDHYSLGSTNFVSFLGLSKLAPEQRKHTAEMPWYYYCLIFLGCVAPVFAAFCLPFDRVSILGTTAAVVLMLLGIVAWWAGSTVAAFVTSPGEWWVIALFGWIYAGAICRGIFTVTLIIRLVWTWVRSLTKTSPEDSVSHDQVAQATSAPEISNGDPYSESATEY